MAIMNDETRLAYNRLWEILNEEDPIQPALDYWKDPQNFSSFSTLLCDAAKTSGYAGEIEDKTAVCRYILSRCVEMGIDLSAKKRNLQNWLNDKNPPSRDEAGRDTIFKICFALGMNLAQAADFFRRAYWERPFIYKRKEECVYWYCLSKGKDYRCAESILSRIDERRADSHFKDGTAEIFYAVSKCTTDDELIEFLSVHALSFAEKNVTAAEELRKLLRKSKTCAEQLVADPTYGERYRYIYGLKEKESLFASEEITDDSAGNEKLFSVIYNVRGRSYDDKGYVKKGDGNPDTDIAGSFPSKYASENLPSAPSIRSILNHTVSKDDSIRKALVLLDFFCFYTDWLLSGQTSTPVFYDDFESEINNLLTRSGFPELYLRNPYDWVFFYCSTQDDPLDAFQDIISPLNREKD